VRNRRLVAAFTGLIAAATLAAPASAADGWLDRTFNGDGWVRLPADVPPGGVSPMDAAVRPGPNGSLTVGRHYSHDEAGVVEGLLLAPSGNPVPTFNGGQWRTMMANVYGHALAGFWASGGGGLIGAYWEDLGETLVIREQGTLGRILQSQKIELGAFRQGSTNVLRLPGGSFRTCYRDQNTDEDVLLGLKRAPFELDPAVGPEGRRVIDAGCDLVGSDTTGHLYFARQVSGGVLEIARTTTSGVLDTAWAVDGRATIAISGLNLELPARFSGEFPNLEFAFSRAAPVLHVLADGSMVLAARASSEFSPDSWNAALVKLTSDGQLDQAFGSGGLRAFGPPVGGTSRLFALAVDATGRPLVSVVYEFPDGSTRAYLARFTTVGLFDQSFGSGGRVQVTNAAGSVAFDAQGRILTAGWAGTSIIVARRDG
jgi:uncharacterized delta-60 repeat protein